MSRYRRTNAAHLDASVTLGELAAVCLDEHGRAVNSNMPSPWHQLLAELRQAGYLSANEDLASILPGDAAEQLIQASYLTRADPSRQMRADRSKLELQLPEDMVERLWVMIEPFRYVAEGGYLVATHSTSAPYTSAQAIGRFGMKLVVQARASANQFRAPLPGRAVARRLDRVLQRAGPLIVAVLSPVLAPVWVVSAAAAARQRGRSSGAARRRRTGSELNQWLVYAVCLAIPAISVAAWYAIWASHFPPHGPAGRWIALGLAALFGAQNIVVLYFFTLSFAMDGSNEARQSVSQPIRYLSARAFPVLVVILAVNAPLTLILLVIRLIIWAA